MSTRPDFHWRLRCCALTSRTITIRGTPIAVVETEAYFSTIAHGSIHWRDVRTESSMLALLTKLLNCFTLPVSTLLQITIFDEVAIVRSSHLPLKAIWSAQEVTTGLISNMKHVQIVFPDIETLHKVKNKDRRDPNRLMMKSMQLKTTRPEKAVESSEFV